MSLEAEVCLAHRDAHCKTCDEFNDDLWVHPRDLPAPHKDCRLCEMALDTRRQNIAALNRTIEDLESDISEIEDGRRHNAFHEEWKAINQ